MRPLVDRTVTGLCWVGRAAAGAGAASLALQIFRAAHKLSPRHTIALRDLAWGLHETGDLDAAIACYKDLLELSPSFVEGRGELGFIFASLERYPEAIEQFQRALDYAPRDPRARTGLAAMLMCINHHAEAIPLCEELVQDDPADAVAWGFLARARAEAGQWEDALTAYDTAQRLQSDPLIAAEQVSVLMELARYVDAEAVLKTALTTHPGDQALHVLLASAFLEQQRHLDAERVLREVLREDPVNAPARHALATLLAATARASEAAAIGDGLLADFPEDPTAHATAGLVALKSGRWRDALTAFENAADIEVRRPPSGMAKLNLHAFMAGRATALKGLGRHADAQALVTAIAERDASFFDRHPEYAELTRMRELDDVPPTG